MNKVIEVINLGDYFEKIKLVHHIVKNCYFYYRVKTHYFKEDKGFKGMKPVEYC